MIGNFSMFYHRRHARLLVLFDSSSFFIEDRLLEYLTLDQNRKSKQIGFRLECLQSKSHEFGYIREEKEDRLKAEV